MDVCVCVCVYVYVEEEGVLYEYIEFFLLWEVIVINFIAEYLYLSIHPSIHSLTWPTLHIFELVGGIG
jgi:hypothetical protein